MKLQIKGNTVIAMIAGQMYISDEVTDAQMEVLKSIGVTEAQVLEILNPRLMEVKQHNEQVQDLSNALLDSGLFEERNGSYYRKGNPISIPKMLLEKFKESLDFMLYPEDTYFKKLDNFWLKCSLNPNKEARENTFWFLEKYGFSIVNSGDILAYRNVNIKQEGNKELHDFIAKSYTKVKAIWKKSPKNYYINKNHETGKLSLSTDKFTSENDLGNLQELYDSLADFSETIYTDQYSGTYRIQIGVPVSMPRENCDETQTSCSRGLHLAGAAWLTKDYFGKEGLICLVNPMNIVSVPTIDNYGKLRCCEYLPIGVAEYNKEGRIIPIDTTEYEVEYDQHSIAELNKVLQKVDPTNQVVHTLKMSTLTPQVFNTIDKYRTDILDKVVHVYDTFDSDDLDYDDEYWEEE